MAVAWAETLILVVIVYFIGTKLLQLTPEQRYVNQSLPFCDCFSIVTSGGLSICGSSAAISIKEAVDVEEEAVSSLIMIMSIATIPYIPALPIIGTHLGLNNETMAAWIGTTTKCVCPHFCRWLCRLHGCRQCQCFLSLT